VPQQASQELHNLNDREKEPKYFEKKSLERRKYQPSMIQDFNKSGELQFEHHLLLHNAINRDNIKFWT